MTRGTETLLWQGRPDAAIRWSIRSPVEFAFGLTLFGGPIQPSLLLFLSGNPWWLIFLPLYLLGAWLLVGWCLWDALRRRLTRYYLSDRRAVIDTYWPGFPRRVEHAIDPETEIRLERPHLWFDRAAHPTWDGRQPPDIGFEYLDDAERVADLMRRAQWALVVPPEGRPS